MEVRYQADTGEELLLKVAQLDVKANGELNISEELVDPYGTVYDETTGDAVTGTKIAGAKITLYYADTQRNRDNGRTPDTKVTLPAVHNFPPHDNKSPEQDSDANGFYAYMVFPEADYYLIVTKEGYETHRSHTISVDYDIVRYDVPMKPIRSGGGTDNGSGGGTDNGSGGTDNGSGGTDNASSGTDNGSGGTDNGSGETDNGSGETDNGRGETDNGSGETDNGSGETDNGSGETDNGSEETDNGSVGSDNGSSETGHGSGETNNSSTNGSSGTDEPGNAGSELDNVPKTGDNDASPIRYMILALASLLTIGLCLLSNKKKKLSQ
jgi:hypothetical protein